MAEAPAGGGGAKQDPQALIAKHAAVTQSGAAGDAAIVTRVENSIKNSPMGWLQGMLGETSSRASAEQGEVHGKLAEHESLVSSNQKDAPKDAGPPPPPGPAAHPAVPQPQAAAAKGGAVAQHSEAAGPAAEHAPVPAHPVATSGKGAAPASVPAPTIVGAVAGAGSDAQLDGILNAYTPKSPQTTQTLGRIKQMGDVANGFNGQLDVYVSQGGAIDSTIAGASNFLGVGKDAGAVWRNNPYRKVHGILGGIMTGMSAVKSVCSIVGSICGKLGLVLTVIGLLGMIFPPIGAAVSGIARILSVVGMICDAISFVLSGILTGLNGVVLAQQISAGASAEEKAATADMMMSESNEAASGFINLAMVFGPKFMKGMLGSSKGIVASLIKRAKATIGRVSLKVSSNVSHFANKIVRKLGFGGAGMSRVGGAWKDTGMIAGMKEKVSGSAIGRAFNGAPKHLEAVQEKLMAKYGNTTWAKNMDRVGAWGGSVAHRFDIEEKVGKLGEKSGKWVGGLGADTKMGKSMAAAAERSELQTRELAMKMESRDAAHLEQTQWRNELKRRQAANPDHVRSPEAENKFVAAQGQKVHDQHEADFAKAERQREGKERLEQMRSDRFDRRNDEFYDNKTNGITGVGARDQMMGSLHNSRAKRYELEAQFKPQETERKELLAKATRTADEQTRLTALNGELRSLDEARRLNKLRETDLSGLAAGTERVRAPEYNNWKDVTSNAWDQTAPMLEMMHMKSQDSAWEVAEKANLKKQTKYNKGGAQANAAGRGGHGTFEEIAADARRREMDELAEFVRATPQSTTISGSVRSMLSGVTARAPGVHAQEAPHAQGGTTVTPTARPREGEVATTAVMSAQVHEPAAAPEPAPAPAPAPAAHAPQEEPDDGGGEALPYWPALLPEFDQASKDFGWMRKVAVEFKKAQIEGKQKAVDTLAVYGRYREYAQARAAAAKKNQAGAQQTGAATQQNVQHAQGTEGQAAQGEAKQGEAKGAANNKAATDLPEPESRGFWGRILGAVKRWAKNKAAQVFGWIQEKIASVILKGLCGVSMGDMREYAGALRRQQQAAHGVAGDAAAKSGQADQTSVKLGADATKEAQGAADAIGECDKNIGDADQFMADIVSFEGQLSEEKAHAQMFISQVQQAAHAEQAKRKAEAAAQAAEQQKEQARTAALGAQPQQTAPTPVPTPAPAPTAEPAHEQAPEDPNAASDATAIHSASDYVASQSETLASRLEARADDYTNQLALALTNRTGKGGDGVDLKGPAKKESKHIVEEFKEAAQHTKADMEAFHSIAIEPSHARQIAEQIINSAQHLETSYTQSENSLDELFARTYNGIKEGRRTLKSRMLDGDNVVGHANDAGNSLDNHVIDTALPQMNTTWNAVSAPIQTPPPVSTPPVAPDTNAAPVQRKASGDSASGDPGAVASKGVDAASERLPHHDQIQASFGKHDVSHVKAQTGGAAAEASKSLGASAYAQGDRVGFANSPDLHTAAHEAAHVVQQQGGVQLKGGIDAGKSDPYEQHADAVADKVVKGESAEGLLDQMGPKKGAASSVGPVQRKEEKAEVHRSPLERYLIQNETHVWNDLKDYLASITLPDPHQRLHWTGEQQFLVILGRQLSQNINLTGLTGLDEILHPQTVKGAVGGLVPTTSKWTAEFSLALSHALHLAVVSSVQRMGARYVEYGDSAGMSGELTLIASQLVASMPMDRYVANALCSKRIVSMSKADAKTAAAAKGKPTGLRDVELEWQSGDMWNWVKANPADATAEEVAAKLWVVTDGYDERKASFNAYLLAASPPLFGVPKRFAIKNPKVHAPANALAGEDSVDRQLTTLATSSSADASALQQVTPESTPDGKSGKKGSAAPANADYAAVKDLITDLLTQLRFAEKEAMVWGLHKLVAPAIQYLLQKDHDLKSADPAKLGEWLRLFGQQKDRLSRITGGMHELVTSSAKLGITDPKSPQASAAREILEKFALAAGISHLAQPSEAKLAEALRLQSTLAVRALQATESNMVGSIEDAEERTSSGPTQVAKFMGQMSSDAGQLQAQSRVMQMRMLNGGKVDQDEFEDVSIRSGEVTLLAKIEGVRTQLFSLNQAAQAAGKGDAAIIASIFSGRFRDMPSFSKHVFDDLAPIFSTVKSEHASDDPNASAAAKAQQRIQRREQLGKENDRFNKVAQRPDVVEFFKTAAETLQNQQFRTAIVQTAIMLGISVVAGAAAGIAARAVGGVLLEAGGVAAVEELGTAARFGINTAKAATQIGVDTTINSAGMAAQGRDFGESWKENLLMALASTAVFGSINHFAQAAERREAEVAMMEGRVVAPKTTWAKAGAGGKAAIAAKEVGALTAHTIWGAAMQSVADRIVTGESQPPPATLREWALQGVAVAVGRHVNERVVTHSEMYKALEQKAENGGRALTQSAQKLTALAKEVIANKNPHRAVDLLVEHDRFLNEEIEAVKRAMPKTSGAEHDQLVDATRNLDREKEIAGGSDMLATKMALLGMEELVPGALWKGTNRQIHEALDRQSPRPKVLHEGPKWKLELPDRVIEINEVTERVKTPADQENSAPDRTKAGAPAEVSGNAHATPTKEVENAPAISGRSNERLNSLAPAQRQQIESIFSKAEPRTGQQQMLERAFAAGHSASELESLRAAMVGKSGAELETMFSGIGVVQLYQQSCVPTSYQIAIADVDPYFAFQLRNHPELMMNAQQEALSANHSAQTKRIDINKPNEHLGGHLDDPGMRQKLNDPKSYSEHGDKGGIEATQMTGSALHKQLEQATGAKYEVITATRKQFATKGQGQFDHTAMPHDRIDAALDNGKPVIISTDRLGAHAQVIKSRTVAPDGKVTYTIVDPATGKPSQLEAAALGWMGTFAITVPAETGGARTAPVEQTPHTGKDTHTRTGTVGDDHSKVATKEDHTGKSGDSAEDWNREVVERLKDNPAALAKYEAMKRHTSTEAVKDRYRGDAGEVVKDVVSASAAKASKEANTAAVKEKSAQAASKLKADLHASLAGERQADGTFQRSEIAERIRKIISRIGSPDEAIRVSAKTALEQIRTLVIEHAEVGKNQRLFPGSEILTEVDVYTPEKITQDAFAKMPRDEKHGLTAKPFPGKEGVYRKITDIDVLVIGPNAKALKMEQIKTGVNDTHKVAKGQNKDITDAVQEGKALVFVSGAKDVTSKIDVSSLTTEISKTAGPANEGYDDSLELTAKDLEKTLNEFIAEEKELMK